MGQWGLKRNCGGGGLCRDQLGKYIVAHWHLGGALYLVMSLRSISILF